MLDKLECELVERRIGAREFHRDLSHVLAIQRHPGGAIRLFKVPAAGKGIAAIEDPNVVKAEEPSFKDILPKTVFPVNPPLIQAVASQRPHPPAPARACEMPGPTLHTTDIPICPAWK